MKGVSRNKFLLCFRPVDLDARERSVGPYIAGKEPIPSPRKRFLPPAVRSVLYHIILRKGVRDNQGFSSSKRSNSLTSKVSSSSSSSSCASNDNKTEDLEDEETKPNSVPESTNPSTRKPSKVTQPNQNASAKLSLIDSGLFLFLISLAMTVLWGKLSAILFTSIWIYFLQLSRDVLGYQEREKQKPARLQRSRSADSKHKKRVVTESI